MIYAVAAVQIADLAGKAGNVLVAQCRGNSAPGSGYDNSRQA
jgi:hypothetical protein